MQIKQFARVHNQARPGTYIPLEYLSTTASGVIVVNPLAPGAMVVEWANIDPIEVFVRQFYLHWNNNDMPYVVGHIHPDYQGQLEVGAVQIPTTGRAGFQADRERGAKALQDVHITVLDIAITGSGIEILTHLTARQLGPYAGRGHAGDTFNAYSMGTWTIVDDMIATNHEKIMIVPML